MRVLVVNEDHAKAETQAKKTAPFSIRALLSDYVLEHSNLQEFKDDCAYIRTKVDELFRQSGRKGTAPPSGYWYELAKHVKNELLDQLYSYGTPDECVAKIRELEDSDITQIVFSIVPIGGRTSGNYNETMKLAFDKVIQRI